MASLRLKDTQISHKGGANFRVAFDVVYDSEIIYKDTSMTPMVGIALNELREYRDKLEAAVKALETFLEKSKLPEVKKEADLAIRQVSLVKAKKRGRPRKEYGIPVETIFPKARPKNGRRKKLNAKKKSKMSKKK